MAVSDITAYVKSEQGLPEVAKASAAVKQDTGDAFSYELKQADSSDASKILGEANSAPVSEVINESEQTSTAQETTEPLSDESSGDVMLAQITASQAIDTGVKQLKITADNDEATVSLMQSSSAKSTAFSVAFAQSTNETNSTTSPTLVTGDKSIETANKTKLADAIGDELNASKSVAVSTDEKVLNKIVAQPAGLVQQTNTQQLTDSVSGKTDATGPSSPLSAPKEVIAKIDNAVQQLIHGQSALVQSVEGTGNDVATGLNLTKAQALQLNDKLAQLNTEPQHTTDSKSAALKAMLAEFVATDKSTTTDSKTALNNGINATAKSDAQAAVLPLKTTLEIDALNSNEKSQLAEKIQGYINDAKPNEAELKKLNQALAQLQLPTAKQNTPSAAAASEISANIPLPENTNKQVKETNTELNIKALAQETVSAERAANFERSTSKDTALPRVTQLFNQLTTISVPPTTPQELTSASYEQALDAHIAQTQATTTANPVKMVSIDAGVMQALNIIKSDAAKMLQERVSAMLNINNKEAEIRLDPPEMGSMHIRIRSDAEQAQINFVVQNQQAKEALEQSMPKLREMLAEQGIELEESSIEQGQSQAEQGDGDNQSSQAGLTAQQSDDESSAENEQLAKSTGQQSSSSIDYYA